MDTAMEAWLEGLPKVELHLHIEGSLEPEMLFALAKRNNIDIPFESVEEIRNAYRFTNLQSFLDIYYQGMKVLITEEDFFDLTFAYFTRAKADNVRHAEIMFDPQGHTSRGVKFETVVKGIRRGMKEAEKQLGVTSKLILSFLRHLSEEDAFATLEEAMPFKDEFASVGLDSSENGHPPSKFQKVYQKCMELGWLPVAHAGEEGPPSYIAEALDLLKVKRIDHGVRILEDSALVERVKNERQCLTVCPTSNTALKVIKDMKDHPMAKLLDAGLVANINSDDPAYFGGYMNENFKQVCQFVPGMNKERFIAVSRNGIEGCFLDAEGKAKLTAELDAYLAAHQ